MRTKIVFCVLFLIIIILPAALFDFRTGFYQRENRVLAPLPTLTVNGAINHKFTHEVEVYLQDRFGLRTNLLTLHNKVHKIGGKQMPNLDKTIKGKDGWLFLIAPNDGDNLKDFLKTNIVTQAQAQTFADNIQKRADWCAAHGIQFLFVITPNKHSIYPEFYPIKRPPGPSRTDLFVQALQEKNVNYIYLNELLINNKAKYDIPLYYRLDTHWNELGTYIAYKQAILPTIKRLLNRPDLETTEFEYTIDLNSRETNRDMTFLFPADASEAQPLVTFKPQGKNWSDLYTEEFTNKTRFMEAGYTVNINRNLPRAIVFRDSFFWSLKQFTSTNFSHVEYRWTVIEDSDKEHILNNKPDIVILELIERKLPFILEKIFNFE